MYRHLLIILLLHILSYCGGWAQPQAIPLHGTIIDSDGIPVAGAEVKLSFNGSDFAQTRSESDGTYRFADHYYGKVQKVDINIQAEGCKELLVQNIPIDSIPLNSTLTRIHSNGIIIYGHKPHIIACGDRVICELYEYEYNYRNMVRFPWGTMAYYKTGWETPVTCYDKMIHYITITDTQGSPVPNARVNLRFRDEEDYWGQTDSSGKVRFYIAFNTAAREGNVQIKASGYKSKRVWAQVFAQNNRNTYVIKTDTRH